jgi:hypothetical protein
LAQRIVRLQSSRVPFAVCLAAIVLFISGCVISPRRGPGSSSTTQSAAGQIYVSNSSSNTILRFANAPKATGNVGPTATISGPATQLASPQYLLLDNRADRLFVSNQTSGDIVIFEKASTRKGNTAPDRTIGGATTSLAAPVDLALDAGRDQLYVADGANVLVFASASTITGNVAPVRTIAIGFLIASILLDSSADRLFVANDASSAIDIFDGAHLLDHVVSPNRSLSGPSTRLSHPSGLQIDPSGRLVVSNPGSASVTFYSDAATVNGNAAPVATIDGVNTSMGAPTQMAVVNTAAGGDLYIADGAAAGVLVFSNIDSINGNTIPARNIKGPDTGLTRSANGAGPPTTKGIAVDTIR